MASIEAQVPVSTIEEHVDEHAEEHAAPVGDDHPADESQEQPGEHAAADVVESTSDETHAYGVSEDHHPADNAAASNKDTAAEAPAAAEAAEPPKTPSAPSSPAKKVTAKPSVATKTTASKSGPPTPLVKKIINSGTFGAGAVRGAPAASKAAPAKSPPATATSTIRKASSTTAASASKGSMPPPPAPRSATGTTPTAPSRRASLAPGAKIGTTSPVKTSAAPASISKPTTTTTTATSPPPRGSVASPDSVASLKSSTSARPRAAVSTEVGKRPPPSRSSTLGPNATTVRPPSAGSTRPARTGVSASISSIRDVKGDSKLPNKAVEELESKLSEATASLASKTEEVETLKSSLDEAVASAEAKESTIADLEKSKESAEKELADLKESLAKLQAEREGGDSSLQAVKNELEAAKVANSTQQELIESLQTKIESLEAELNEAKQNLDILRSSSSEASVAQAAAAAIEHEALLKAKADLEVIQKEVESLNEQHARALAEVQERLSAQKKDAATKVVELEGQVAELKQENEDKSNKVSELEVEILELKEEQEGVEEERGSTRSKIEALEQEIAKANEALEEAIQAAKTKEDEYARASAAASAAHEEKLAEVAAESEKLSARIKELGEEIVEAKAAIEAAKAEAAAADEDHARRVKELEKAHQEKQAELQEEINRITVELESQETKYNAKVDAVKAEHEQLLQEAFTRAKSEAGSVHGQELQSLRAESQSTIEQLRSAHQSTIDSLKAEHAAEIETQVKAKEKTIATQALELNAAREDLSKSKTSIASLTKELEAAKAALEEQKQLVASLDKSDKDETIANLSKELANVREEYSALTDMFMATNESLREMTNNHATELQEAAKGRAMEVTKLRAAHQEEIDALTRDRTELTVQLSDLQGEVATLKASLSSARPSTPSKANGSAHLRKVSTGAEDLQKLHEAHNLKLYDLKAEHDRELQAMRAELEAAQARFTELSAEVDRKNMEIQYLEADQEESQDQITRLKEDIEHLTAQLQLQAQR